MFTRGVGMMCADSGGWDEGIIEGYGMPRMRFSTQES